MNEYDIAIRETLEMTVTVEAENREEARRMVEERWKNGEYILDADRGGIFPSAISRGGGGGGGCFFGCLFFWGGEGEVFVQL